MATYAQDKISFEEFSAIRLNQCPLPPRKYKYKDNDGKEREYKGTAWFYKDKFWIKETDSNDIYPVDLPPKEFVKYKKRLNKMRTVDEYISGFGLTTSVDIYKMLTEAVNRDALSASTQGKMKKDAKVTGASIYAKKFNPTWWNRLGFLAVIFRAALNAYFIVTNFITIYDVPTNYRIFVFIVVCIEAILFLIAFLRTLYNVYSLLRRLCKGTTTHFQVKNIPENLRQLGSLSVMRYLPNGESVMMFRKRGNEWLSEKKASYKFEVSNARTFKYLVILRWVILSILDIIGPFVAVFSLLFKMAQLNFQFESFGNWQWFTIVGYFAFVNQVAGIRKVRKIEIDALEHFIFSGSDIKLSVEENLLLDAWWNYTIVSCVANICDEFKYPVYDSIIFWYNLNIRRIQLLFKDHKMEGKDFIDKRNKVKTNVDFTKYDDEVRLKLKGHHDDQQMEKVKTMEEDESSSSQQELAVVTAPRDRMGSGDRRVQEENGDDGQAGALETETMDNNNENNEP